MRSIRDIPILENIPVLVRVALNVTFIDGKLASDYRIRKALPTIEYLSKQGAKVIVVSHIGEAGTETLKPVTDAVAKLTSNVSFCEATVGPVAKKAIRGLDPGDILILENLRRNPGEIKNDSAFAHELAELADVFVQDSFDACHRTHASIVGVPALLPSYAGFVVEEEVKELTKALKPTSPSLAIIGGAKFSTKEPVLEILLKTYDKVFVGGALANDFLKAKGYPIGKSLISNAPKEHIERLLSNPRLVLPLDTYVENEVILDHGPKTAEMLADLVQKSKTVLWNGPLGLYEKGFTKTTDIVARAIAENSTYSIIGGGDTVTEIEHLGLLNQFSFVSTGGGAMLDFLAKGTLPGIVALR